MWMCEAKMMTSLDAVETTDRAVIFARPLVYILIGPQESVFASLI